MFNWIKRRRQKSDAPPPLLECSHTWKDFPWYMKAIYNPDRYVQSIDIYEPYICVHCKKRNDVQLFHIDRYVGNREKGERLIANIAKAYEEHLEDAAIVEDMINDFIYVDREKLEIIEKLRNGNEEVKL